MRHPVVDELEERRLVRRLACLAEAVEPLPDGDLAAILSGVASGSPARHPSSGLRPRTWRHLPGVAAAAAAALAIAVGVGHAERRPAESQARAAAPELLLSFPEGSALELLLARADAERPT